MNPHRRAAFLVYCLFQLLWLPLTIAAYVPFVVKMVLYSRRSGASSTVLASFYPRWMQHRLGTRRDNACVHLMRVLPNVSQLGLDLLTFPTLLAHRLTGYVPTIYRYPFPEPPSMNEQPAARITFFDEALDRHLGEVEQLVILGAGLDTRPYRLPAGAGVRCFEIDAPKTQRFKQAMLARARVDVSGVTFVAVDFERDGWLQPLVAAGFDPTRRAFFIWESVTMYLGREAVEGTLRTIASTAPGSVLAFDYFSTELLKSRAPEWLYARVILNLMGEPFGTFGIDNSPPVREQVAAFLAGCGLTLEEQRNFGQESAGNRAPAGFACALVSERPEAGRG
jgi:methyltransferase (TIGR00027 family)